jgi:multidrug efflux pump subunit AcrA (membrane-fusion protein)
MKARMKRITLLGVVLLGGFATLSATRLTALFGPETVATALAERSVFVRNVVAYGSLEAVEATPILVPGQTAQTIAFVISDGTPVEEGDVVVRFDPYEAQRAAADGRDDLATARSKLGRVDAESESGRESNELDESVAREQLARVRDIAPEDEGIFSRNELVEVRIDRAQLEKRAAAATRKLNVSGRLSAATRHLAQIEESRAEMMLRHSNEGLSSLEITAPHAGLVILSRGWQGDLAAVVGASVWPHQKLAEIPDLTRLRARVHVLESDAAGLQTDLKAQVSLQGRMGHAFAASVESVEPIAKPRDRRSPVKYFEVVLGLTETDLDLMRPGGRVRTVIELERTEGALTVPRAAVFEIEGERYVYRELREGFERVPVRVGRHSLARVVIAEGLSAGDRVALRDPGQRPAPQPDVTRGRAGS